MAQASVSAETTRICRIAWAFAILFTLYAATLPFNFVVDGAVIREHVAAALQRASLSPSPALSRSDILQNVLLFIPIGLVGVRSAWSRRAIGALGLAVGGAAALSTTCEVLQLFTADRVTSAWDVVANVGGALVGALLWFLVRPVVRRAWALAPESATERKRYIPLWWAFALVCVAAFEPFDVTLDAGTVWLKVKPFVAHGLFQWQPVTDECLTGLRYAMVAYLAVDALTRRSSRPLLARATIIAGCTSMALTLEVAQVFITSRGPSLQDVLAAVAGAVAGAVVAAPLVRSIPASAIVTVASVAAAVPYYLQPFTLAAAYGGIAWLPFLAYYQFTSMQTVSHVVNLMLIYAPIGFVIVWSRSGQGVGRAALVTASCAAMLEYSQGWVVGPYPDVTDFGVAVLGGVAGALVARLMGDDRGIVARSEAD
jgi:glycopeptide antibiotics resistance protein